jgi:hypothetical protein
VPLWRTLIAFVAAPVLGLLGSVVLPVFAGLLDWAGSTFAFADALRTLAPLIGWSCSLLGAVIGLTLGLRIGGFRWLTALGAAVLIVVSVAGTMTVGVWSAR